MLAAISQSRLPGTCLFQGEVDRVDKTFSCVQASFEIPLNGYFVLVVVVAISENTLTNYQFLKGAEFKHANN
jgi:hypothetical protein